MRRHKRLYVKDYVKPIVEERFEELQKKVFDYTGVKLTKEELINAFYKGSKQMSFNMRALLIRGYNIRLKPLHISNIKWKKKK